MTTKLRSVFRMISAQRIFSINCLFNLNPDYLLSLVNCSISLWGNQITQRRVFHPPFTTYRSNKMFNSI